MSPLKRAISIVAIGVFFSGSVASAFNFDFESASGFPVGPAYGTPTIATNQFVADPTNTSARFSIVASVGVSNSQALQMGSTVAKNFESLMIPLLPADYGAASGLPTKPFRIGASVRRTSTLGNRFDPDFAFEWGTTGDFRMVKMRTDPYGSLLVYEANRIMPNVITNVFVGGTGSAFRRIEAVVNYPHRNYKLYIDGVPQLGGRDIHFGTSKVPTNQIEIGFSAGVLGYIYVMDNFSCLVEPGATNIPPPVANQPDDFVSLPLNSDIPYNVYTNNSAYLPSDFRRRENLGGLEINWYISYRTFYSNLPKYKTPEGTLVTRIAENIIDATNTMPAHPRFFFPDLPVVAGKTPMQVLQDRAANPDPEFALVVEQIKRQGQNALTNTFPPVLAAGKIDAEDPGRGMDEILYWIAMDYMMETNATRKAALQSRLKEWIGWHLDFGNWTSELPLGQQACALATMYDWFYNDFLAQDPPFRKRLKYGVANCVRFRGDMANRNGSGRNPIAPPNYNHAWFNEIGPAFAGLALWGEHDADLTAAEIQGWLAEGFNCFIMQQGMMPRDGGLLESWSYGDYGNHPVYDFATQAERLLGLGGQLIDTDHNRNERDRVFYFSPMLKQDQVMRYGDGFIHADGGGSAYHYLAARYRDPRAQLLGNTLIAPTPTYWPLFASSPNSGNNYWPTFWRTMFWYDPTLNPNTFSDLPLFVNQRNFGICSARSGWDTNGADSAVSFRCGANSGLDAHSVWNGTTYWNGHQYPARGHIVFFHGTNEILPTTEWQPVKWSGYYNVPLFTPRDGQLAINDSSTSNTLIGQFPVVDLNVPISFSKPYTDNPRNSRIIHAINTTNVHSYLMEFGGMYKLTDVRGPGSRTYPTCYRRLVYLPEKSVIIVADQIRTFYGRQPVYNIPTRFVSPVLNIASPGNGTVDFTQITNCPVKDGRQYRVNYDGRFVFFSPSAGTPSIDITEVATDRDSFRQTFTYTTSSDVTNSSFGYALGLKTNLAGLSFVITNGNLVISGLPGGDQSYPMNDDNTLPLEAVDYPVFSPGAAPYTTNQAVTLTSSTAGATIYYTTDDSVPSASHGTVYSSPIAVSAPTILRAIAVKSGQPDSPINRAVYTFVSASSDTVYAPTFTPAAGTYSGAQSVTISTTTAGASIRYTTNSSTPTSSNGVVYIGALSISTNATLKAIAYKSGLYDSAVTSGDYIILAPVAADPIFSPAPGSYTDTQSVTITSATAGATIYYTLNGSTPGTNSGAVYSAPVSINSNTTLKAIAIKSGILDSAITSGNYLIQPATDAPVFSLASGTYTGPTNVTMTSTTAGATIRYTVDGTTPSTTNGLTYTGSAVTLPAPTFASAGVTLKAVAIKSGLTDSSITTADYTINHKPFMGFEAVEGYGAGTNLISGTQPNISGKTKWTSDGVSTMPLFFVDATNGNPGQVVSSGPITSGDFPTVASKSARFFPTSTDLGATNPLGTLVLSFDLRLNFAPNASANVNHNIICARDTTGLNQGRVTQISVRNNGNLAFNTDSATLPVKKADGSNLVLTQGQWVSIAEVINYPAHTYTLTVGGVAQTNASGSTTLGFMSNSITGTGADEFGMFALAMPTAFADWNPISVDNLDFFAPTYRAASNFAATAISPSEINLTWVDPAPDETGYLLETSTNAGGSWATLANLSASVTSYAVTGLSSGSTNHFRLTANYASGASVPVITNATTLLGGLTALEQWRLAKFGTSTNAGNAANTADPDGDGSGNLLEYAFASEPLLISSRPLIVPAITAVGGELRFTLTFNRIADPTLTYSIWASTNLINWGAAPVWSSTGAANIAGPITFTNFENVVSDFFRIKVATP